MSDPLCINCKHFRPYETKHPDPDPEKHRQHIREFSLCAMVIRDKSMVDGHIRHQHASIARLPGGECGPRGKLYEPKEQAA